VSFLATLETAHVDQDATTNSHSKMAIKSPNGLLEDHLVGIDITKKQNDDRDPFPAKSSKTTHLTPLYEDDAFRDLHKISHRTGSLGLIP
jgi:hypothetical protein